MTKTSTTERNAWNNGDDGDDGNSDSHCDDGNVNNEGWRRGWW